MGGATAIQKRQVLANVSMTVSVDYDDTTIDGMNVVALSKLPSLVLSGPRVVENRFFSTNEPHEDVVAGAVGVTERGPIDRAVLCTSFEEFQQRFGGFTPDSDLALAAMGFFENGGSQLWVVRTVHHTDVSVPATATGSCCR